MEDEDSMCDLMENNVVWLIALFALASAVFFFSRSLLIIRLKKIYGETYHEMGCPTYSDVYATKASRRLLHFLFSEKFRKCHDKWLVWSGWATIFVLIGGNVAMLTVLIAAAYCA